MGIYTSGEEDVYVICVAGFLFVLTFVRHLIFFINNTKIPSRIPYTESYLICIITYYSTKAS